MAEPEELEETLEDALFITRRFIKKTEKIKKNLFPQQKLDNTIRWETVEERIERVRGDNPTEQPPPQQYAQQPIYIPVHYATQEYPVALEYAQQVYGEQQYAPVQSNHRVVVDSGKDYITL